MRITAIDMINKISKELEENYNLIVLWNRYDRNDENIELIIYNRDTQKRLLYHWDNEENIYSVLFGIQFAIKSTLKGEIKYE